MDDYSGSYPAKEPEVIQVPKEDTEIVHHKHMSEQTTASPIMNILPNGSDNGGNGYGLEGALAGILPLAFLAPLLRGFGNNEGNGRNLEAVIAEQVGDLRHDIGETAIQGLKQAFEADKDALRAGFEAKIGTLEAINKIDNKIEECCEETQNKFFEIQKSMDEKFCHLSHEMEKGFAHVEEQALRKENEVLKERLFADSQREQTRAIVTDILAAVGIVSPVSLAKKA